MFIISFHSSPAFALVLNICFLLSSSDRFRFICRPSRDFSVVPGSPRAGGYQQVSFGSSLPQTLTMGLTNSRFHACFLSSPFLTNEREETELVLINKFLISTRLWSSGTYSAVVRSLAATAYSAAELTELLFQRGSSCPFPASCHLYPCSRK